jgi:voltage-gated potassium channel
MLKRLNTVYHHVTFALFHDPVRRFQLSLLALGALVVGATLVYMALEGMNFTDALYMTVITITTVGFGEVHTLSGAGRIFTIILIILGVGAATTAISNAIGIVLGPRVWLSIRQRNMERTIMDLSNHHIVCGYGRMGRQVIGDLKARGEKFVLIEQSEKFNEELLEENIPYVIGDATQDEILIEAGVQRARGMVAALNADADNVLATLSARELNPRLYIVARVSASEVESKLRRAGANRVISPYQIGGHRITLSLIRPAVSDFLDHIFRFRPVGEDEMDIEIGQLYVGQESELAGKTIATCGLRSQYQVSILALQQPTKEIVITPAPDYTLEIGATLIVIGPPKNIYDLEKRYPSA